MIDIRPFNTLGGFKNEWLDAKHHFSFGSYRDAKRPGFGRLLVWNDDRIAAGTGFDPHPHKEMEIVTYVRSGAITHRDSLGNEGRTEAGDVQVMHAGTGITHAELNKETTDTTLFQIWILPDRAGAKPGWAAREFPRNPGLSVLASGRQQDANSGALPLNADAAIIAGTLAKGETAEISLQPGRAVYLVPSKGSVTVNGVAVNTRDGAAIANENNLSIVASEDAELVVVEVAA
jgi:redox-sensitive bicupin YhaK (pirin superfamily)